MKFLPRTSKFPIRYCYYRFKGCNYFTRKLIWKFIFVVMCIFFLLLSGANYLNCMWFSDPCRSWVDLSRWSEPQCTFVFFFVAQQWRYNWLLSRIASMKYWDCFRANEAWKKCMSVMYRGSQDVIKKEIFSLHISIYVRVLSSVDLSFGVVETNFNTFLKLVI